MPCIDISCNRTKSMDPFAGLVLKDYVFDTFVYIKIYEHVAEVFNFVQIKNTVTKKESFLW